MKISVNEKPSSSSQAQSETCSTETGPIGLDEPDPSSSDQPPAMRAFEFDNSYARDLPGFYASLEPTQVAKPELIAFNRPLAQELGLDVETLDSPAGAQIFSGNQTPTGAEPLAQAYAGHQFGGFSPQLGDGRALLLGEVLDAEGQRRDIQLKGSGRTPFSRGGDGRAALGPILREYLIAEAMHALGIPTTRALAAVTTGEQVYREEALPGAILTRVAASHIRVGTFQFFAARGDVEKVRQLADYTIHRHYPELAQKEAPYFELLQAVGKRQAKLIARWMQVGFVHGVMNTDNMAVSGETIDYGPCAFMDTYDPATVFSSIDTAGRYSFANQPLAARWNLARLAEALLPLLDETESAATELANQVVDRFPELFLQHWLDGMRTKLGLSIDSTDAADDLSLITDLLTAMEATRADYTLTFRSLAEAAGSNSCGNVEQLLQQTGAFDLWLPRWRSRCSKDPMTPGERAHSMKAVNPIYIPRNHHVEAALHQAVQEGDYSAFKALHRVLLHPYNERADGDVFAGPGPCEDKPYITFCGT